MYEDMRRKLFLNWLNTSDYSLIDDNGIEQLYVGWCAEFERHLSAMNEFQERLAATINEFNALRTQLDEYYYRIVELETLLSLKSDKKETNV